MVSNTSRNGGAIMIGLNRRRTMGNALPYDAEIEYLESSGTQWIDTGVKLTDDMGFKIVFKSKLITTGHPICGVFKNSGGNLCPRFGASYLFVVYNDSTYINTTFDKASTRDNNTTILVNTAHTIFINNSNRGSFTRNTQVNESNFLLFGANGNSNHSSLMIYEFSLFSSDGVIFDGIPVKKNGIGYMYDKVSGQLFGNSGTGNFILGNDK